MCYLKYKFILVIIVHPKMKMSPWFTHPKAILGVYDFFPYEYSRSYIKMPWLFQAL